MQVAQRLFGDLLEHRRGDRATEVRALRLVHHTMSAMRGSWAGANPTNEATYLSGS